MVQFFHSVHCWRWSGILPSVSAVCAPLKPQPGRRNQANNFINNAHLRRLATADMAFTASSRFIMAVRRLLSYAVPSYQLARKISVISAKYCFIYPLLQARKSAQCNISISMAGPRGRLGYFSAHMWRNLHHYQPNRVAKLAYPGSHRRRFLHVNKLSCLHVVAPTASSMAASWPQFS